MKTENINPTVNNNKVMPSGRFNSLGGGGSGPASTTAMSFSLQAFSGSSCPELVAWIVSLALS